MAPGALVRGHQVRKRVCNEYQLGFYVSFNRNIFYRLCVQSM